MFKKMLKKVGLWKDGIRLRGDLEIVRWGKDGKLIDYKLLENIITDVGCAWIADQCSDGGQAAMKYMAVGTKTQAPAGGNTKLVGELDRNVMSGSAPSQLTGANDHKFQCKGTWAAGDATGALTEAGVLNHSTVGSMLCYVTFSVINKGAADSLTITWTISVADDGV